MIDNKSLLGIAGALAACVQYGIYIKDVLQGKTRPHAFSWFVWGLPCGIVFAAQFFGGGGPGAWTTAVTTILCTLIFILSLFYGEKKITKLDWASLITALVAILLWVIVKNPLWSVILITIIDFVGFIPTARKSIDKPHEETLSCYVISGAKWILSLLSMSNFSFTVLLYPAAMVLGNWAMAGLLLVRREVVGNELIRSLPIKNIPN